MPPDQCGWRFRHPQRRAEVIGRLAGSDAVGHAAADTAAAELGISRRQVYELLRRWRAGSGVVSDLVPGKSSGGRGREQLPEPVEAVIREALRTRYGTTTDYRRQLLRNGLVRCPRHRRSGDWAMQRPFSPSEIGEEVQIMLQVAANAAPATHHSGSQRMPQEPPTTGLTVPDLAQRRYVPPAHFAVARVDNHGRIASTSSLHALGWKPGAEIAFTVDDNRLITAIRSAALSQQQSTAPRRVVGPQRHLNLPILTRRRAGITSGDRLLLAADDRVGLLRIYPPKVLALILEPYTIQQATEQP